MSTSQYVARVFIALGAAGLAAIAYAIRIELMLAFGAILFAAVLNAIADPFMHRLGIRHGQALSLAGIILIIAVAALFYLFGTRVTGQLDNVIHQLPQSLRSVFDKFGASDAMSIVQNSSIGTMVMTIGRDAIDAVIGALFMIVAGIYMSINPGLYRDGFTRLFPPSWHGLIRETLNEMGEAMRLFLASQLIAMCLVGVLIGAGMWIIGVPSPAALGVIAGICEFVPLIGPVVGAIPPLLMAFAQGTQQALLALAVVIVVEQLEAHLIMPNLARRMVAIGAAAGIFSVLIFGTLFGVIGVIFGYPLAIVLDTGIRRLYLRETLREQVKIVSEESLEKRREREG